MSVIFDQLRINDSGELLYVDAHVNKAECFKDMYINKITICTEDQVSETNPLAYGEDFIYQETYEPNAEAQVVPLTKKIIELSEKQLLNTLNAAGGIMVSYSPLEESETNYLSILLSGKFSVLDTGFTPKLVVATKAYDPDEDSLNNPEVLFIMDGEAYEDKDHKVWQFKGKGEIKENAPVHIYLYKQTADGEYELVSIKDTDDIEFLHFFYHAYSQIPVVNKKELHLVLNKYSFNEKFTQTDLSHNMFFVYIETEGIPCPDVPCRLDEQTTLGVTFDYGLLYNQAMGYTRQLADDCNMPQGFMDFILNVEAIKMAIETEHYVPAIEHWRWLMGNTGNASNNMIKPCGCHG